MSNRPVPPGQPDHRSTKGPVSHHVARPQSTNEPRTASEPRPQDKRHTIHCVQITLPAAATLQFGNSVWVRIQTVFLLRFASELTVPSSHLQLSTQANVSITLFCTSCGLTVVVHRVASPLGTTVTIHHRHSMTPAFLIIARQHQTSRNSLCYLFRILLTNGQQRLQVLILTFGCLHSLC